MSTPVEIAFKFFKDNQSDLFKQYPDKYLIISGHNVVKSVDNLEDAVKYTIEAGMTPGEFIIQQCTGNDSAYTQTFHSRAIFA